MPHFLAFSALVVIFSMSQLLAFTTSDAADSQATKKPSPIKISSCPPPPRMDAVREVANGKVVARLEIEPSGSVAKSIRVDGSALLWNRLNAYIGNMRFSPNQSDCQGPWTADVELSVQFSGVPGRYSAKIQVVILSAKCVSKTHRCPYSS